MDEARRAALRRLASAGVSSRDAKRVLPEGTTGFSSSNVSRGLIADGERCLEQLQTRRFDDEPIVAAYLDGTAIGTRGKKRTVLIVVGVTADGRKIGLNAGIAQHEKANDIYPIVESVVKRGVDPGILWIADQGSGIRAALERLTHPQPLRLQGCTTHAAGNVKKQLPEEMHEDVWKRLYWAWSEESSKTALEQLGELAGELEEIGEKEAASSLRGSMEATVTVNDFGLSPQVRRQLRSTNVMESINASVKGKATRNITRWRDDRMRLRWVAWQLDQAETSSWTRLAGPQELVGLMERFTPGRHDAEAILAKLPPSMTVETLQVTAGDDTGMRDVAERWCAEHPDAVWSGDEAPLTKLGLSAGEAVQPAALLDAMRCRNPTSKAVLRKARISVESRDARGMPVKERVDGILNMSWELKASPAAMREWQQGGAAREQVEARMIEAARAAVTRATLTTEPHHGFAGAMALLRPSASEPDAPLRVAGLTFAVQRGKEARLGSPATDEMLRSATARAAEDVAREVLDGASAEVAVAASASEVPPEVAAPVSRELLAGVQARALEIAPLLVDAPREDLERDAGHLDLARRGLNLVETEVAAWRERHWQGAARQIAAAGLEAQGSPDGRQDPWGPLTPDKRRLLGEMHSQWLLGDAALLAGTAEVDAATERELRMASGDPLAELNGAGTLLDFAGAALAAKRELKRRQLFEQVRAESGQETAALGAEDDQATASRRDARRDLSLHPVRRYERALGSERAAALGRYAEQVAPQVQALGEEGAKRLAAATEHGWSRFDRAAGIRLAGLERDRAAALGERLTALRKVGRETALGRQAERDRNANDYFAADDRANVARNQARASWQRLRELEDLAHEERELPGSPDLLVRHHPEAALHLAAQAELMHYQPVREPEPPAAAALREPSGIER